MRHIDSLSNVRVNDKEGNWHIHKPLINDSFF